MVFGSFLYFSKYSSSKFGESGVTRRGKGFQKVAEFSAKEIKEERFGEDEKLKLKLREKDKRREKGVDKSGKYNFKESGIGDSWLIGDDSTNNTNAYVNYVY